MKAAVLFYFLLIVSVKISRSQGFDNVWILGFDTVQGQSTGRTQIDFTNGSPNVQLANRYISFRRTNASICDSSGNLQFYTNGFFIVNNNEDTLLNGAYIDTSAVMNSWIHKGSFIPQGAMVIPRANYTSQYYLFHEKADLADVPGVSQIQSLYLAYSLIDMTLNGGKGEVTTREHHIFDDTLFLGGITGVKHANGRDWWIIKHENNSNGFYTILVTPDTILGPYIQYIGQQLNFGGNGQSVFSPNGNHLAMYDNLNDLDVFDFDRCSGKLTNYRHVTINDSAGSAGVAFSNNSRFLYVSSYLYLYQFDMSNQNFASSQTTVAIWDSFFSPGVPFATTFYLAQLGPDGKIYINNSNGTNKLHVINSPDSMGLSCDVCQHCIHLPTYNAFTIPNSPNYYLGPENASVCDSLNSGINAIREVASLKIYPNPASDFLWIDFHLPISPNCGALNIYNFLGILILQKPLCSYFNTAKIECNQLPAGIYYVTIVQSDRNLISGKFVKM